MGVIECGNFSDEIRFEIEQDSSGMDRIIPANSYELISEALKKAGNTGFEVVLLEGASHSMHKVGQSDFPYWSKLHPDYVTTIEDWVNFVNGN